MSHPSGDTGQWCPSKGTGECQARQPVGFLSSHARTMLWLTLGLTMAWPPHAPSNMGWCLREVVFFKEGDMATPNPQRLVPPDPDPADTQPCMPYHGIPTQTFLKRQSLTEPVTEAGGLQISLTRATQRHIETLPQLNKRAGDIAQGKSGPRGSGPSAYTTGLRAEAWSEGIGLVALLLSG